VLLGLTPWSNEETLCCFWLRKTKRDDNLFLTVSSGWGG
jgi:hypothetical protein